MTIEYKRIKAAPMGIDDRTVTGIFCVHGNVDDGDGWSSRDRSHPGLFGDFRAGGRDRTVFLWSHNSYEPPIATIDELFEVSGADLPPAIRAYAPEATGGVAVRRTYLETPKGDEVLAGLKAGAIREMSYGYEAVRWDFEKQDDDSRGLPIRNLYEARLYDVSDVNWGMNPATSADGAKARPLAAHGEAVKADVATYTARVAELLEARLKEGRTFSAANYAALTELAGELEGSATKLRELLAKGEPKSATDSRQVLLQAQRTLALLNGVRL